MTIITMPSGRTYKCSECENATESMGEDEAKEALSESGLDGWKIRSPSANSALRKTFKFEDFQGAMDAAVVAAEAAESFGHHPKLTVEYGSLVVEAWTYSVDGLTSDDFELARRIDEALSGQA